MPSLYEDLLNQEEKPFDPLEAERKRYFQEYVQQHQRIQQATLPAPDSLNLEREAPLQQPRPTAQQPLVPQEQTPSQVTQPKPDEPGFLSETLKATLGGVYSEIRDIVTNVDRLSGAALDTLGILDDKEKNGILNLQSFLPEVAENQTMAGKLVRGLVEVGTGFLLFGAVGKGIGIGSKVLLGGLTSAAEASLGSKPTDENLTSTLLDFAPSLKDTPLVGPLLTFLKSDPNDSAALQLLKNGIEDVLLSAGFAGAGKLASTFADNFSLSYLKNERGAIGKGVTEGLTNTQAIEQGGEIIGKQTFTSATDELASGNIAGLAGDNTSVNLRVTPQQIEDVVHSSISEGEVSRAVVEKLRLDKTIPEDIVDGIANKIIAHTPTEEVEKFLQSGLIPQDALRGIIGDSPNFKEKIFAYAKLQVANTDELVRAAENATDDELLAILTKTQAESKAFLEAGSTPASYLKNVQDAQKAAGARVSAFQENVGELLQQADNGKKPLDELRQYIKQKGPAALAAQGPDVLKHPYQDALVTIYKNGLLSGPATISRVVLSQSVFLGYELGAGYTAGLYKLATTGDSALLRNAHNLAHGYMKALGEGLSLLNQKITVGGITWEDLLHDKTKFRGIADDVPAISTEAFAGTNVGEVVQRLGIEKWFDGFGRVISLPGTILGNVDKSFRLLTEQAYAHKDALVEATRYIDEQGLVGAAREEAYKLRYNEVLKSPLADTITAANLFADRLGFQRKFNSFDYNLKGYERAVLGRFVEMSQANTVMKVLVPFGNTAANVMSTVLDNTPGLGLFLKSQRELLKQGGDAAAGVIGRQIFASGILATGAYLAHTGILSGAGPTEKTEREIWLNEGNQPYSINVPLGNGKTTHISFKQFGEPVSVLMGLAADLVHMTGEAYEDYEKTGDTTKFGLVANASAAITMATMKNISEKSIIAGLTGLIGASQFPERNLEGYLQQQAGGFIPFSGLVKSVGKALDPTIIEAETFVDGIKKNFAFYNPDLPRKINLFGDPVVYAGGYTPSDYSEDFSFGRTVANLFSPVKTKISDENSKQTAIFRAFSENDITPAGVTGGLESYKGVELTGKEVEYAKKVRGTIALGGRTLEDALYDFTQGNDWKELTNFQKEAFVSRIIRRYTQAALVQLGTGSEYASSIDDRYLKQQADRFGNKPLF